VTHTIVIVFTIVAPGTCCQKVVNGYHFAVKHLQWATWVVLSVGPVAATTKMQDINGGPLGVLPVGRVAATT
jgi:hypothetical protein